MSSPPKEQKDETAELKGGHPPATKVAGGVRITQQTRSKTEAEERRKEAAEEAEFEEREGVPEVPSDQRVVAAAAGAKGLAEDFPPKAIKAYHDKPLPAHSQSHAPPPRQQIQQPRK